MPFHTSFEEIDNRAKVFYGRLQETGIPVNIDGLTSYCRKTQSELNEILASLERKYGFLPNPNRQSDYDLIATSLGFPLPKSSTGHPKTDQWTIERFSKHIPDLQVLQSARSIRRKVSVTTNIVMVAKNGIVYPTYHMDPTLGRTHAGGDVNPMNWELEIQCHVGKPGYSVIVADYNRLELKVLALLSNDKQYKVDLLTDPYSAFAKAAFGVDPTKELRNSAKIANLAMIYGDNDRGLAGKLGINRYAAGKIMAAWYKRYPEATKFLEYLRTEGRKNGYAISYHGRKKPLVSADPLANDRLAVNSPMQNTGGDLAKTGFCNVGDNPILADMGYIPVCTVHDSLIGIIPTGANLELAKTELRKSMVLENDPAFNLDISLKSGDFWGSCI